MMTFEPPGHDGGSERSSRVEGSAGIIDAYGREGGSANRIDDGSREERVGGMATAQFGDEQGQTDADGSQVGTPMFLGRQHEDGEDQLGGQEHLDEQTTDDAGLG